MVEIKIYNPTWMTIFRLIIMSIHLYVKIISFMWMYNKGIMYEMKALYYCTLV